MSIFAAELFEIFLLRGTIILSKGNYYFHVYSLNWKSKENTQTGGRGEGGGRLFVHNHIAHDPTQHARSTSLSLRNIIHFNPLKEAPPSLQNVLLCLESLGPPVQLRRFHCSPSIIPDNSASNGNFLKRSRRVSLPSYGR